MEEVGGFTTAHTLSDQDIVSGLARIDSAENSLAASRLALLAEADRRGLAMVFGHSSVRRWYSRSVRLPEGNIAHQIALGKWLGDNPSVAEALATGAVNYQHVKAIADGIATVLAADPTLTEATQTDIVASLLDVATDSLPRAVHDRSQELAQHAADDARARHDAEQKHREQERREQERRDEERRATSPDDDDPDSTTDDESGDDATGGTGRDDPPPPPLPMSENKALNKLRLYPLANGRRKFEGDFDKLTFEKFLAALSPLTAPKPSPDGSRDPRTPERRNADGLSELLERYLNARPGSGSSGVNVNLTVPLADLLKKPTDGQSSALSPHDPDWPFWLDWTGPISRYLAEYLSCDAQLTPIIVDCHGVPLALGRSFRLASSAQREAVTVRDRCCVMCGRPAQWCQVHHVVYWTDYGPTDLNNLALLCRECHRDIHNTEWELVMGDDGHPYSIPPAESDPERKPIASYHRRRKHSA